MATWQFVTLYCVLYVGTFTANKYVLSVLKFTFPTIFQGWQTAFAIGVMSVGSALNLFHISKKNRQDILGWCHGIFFFMVSIFSGSKALAVLPVPAFVAVQNTVEVFVYIFQALRTRRPGNFAVIISAMMVLVSAYAGFFSDPQYQSSGYRWMAAHVVAMVLLNISQNWLKPASFSEQDCLFYQYLFSLVVFIPGSFLLGDLTDAYYFSHWYKMKFYVGCMLSGLLGVQLSITSIHIKNMDGDILPVSVALSKTLLLIVSQNAFVADLTSDFVFSLLVNMTSYFVFLWMQPSDDGHEKLLEESSAKLNRDFV